MDRHKLKNPALFFCLCGGLFAQGPSFRGVESVNTYKNAAYCADSSVSANTITCSTAVGFVGYTGGQTVDLLLANSVTGAATININSLGTKAVTYNGSTAMATGIMSAGGTYRLQYDGTEFVLQRSVNTSTGAVPGSPVNSVQFNAGAFGGSADFQWLNAAISTPAAPMINQTAAGTPGMTAYSYVAVAHNLIGTTAGSTAGTTATGNATLDGTNWNNVVTAVVVGSVSCDVYRTASAGTPAQTGWIGNVACGATLQDQGLAVDTFGTVGNLPPDVNQTVGNYNGDTLTVSSIVPISPRGDVINGTSPVLNIGPAYLTAKAQNNFVGTVIGYNGCCTDTGLDFVDDVTAFPNNSPGLFIYYETYNARTSPKVQTIGYFGLDSNAVGPGLQFFNGFFVQDVIDGTAVANLCFGSAIIGGPFGGSAGCPSTPPTSGFLNIQNSNDATGRTSVDIIPTSNDAATDPAIFDDNGNWSITHGGSFTGLSVTTTGTNFVALGTPANGTQEYCPDCGVTSSIDNTCAATGSGAQAFRINGAWKCQQ